MIFLRRYRKYTSVSYNDIYKECSLKDIEINQIHYFQIQLKLVSNKNFSHTINIYTPHFAITVLLLTCTPGCFISMTFLNSIKTKIYFIIRPTPDCAFQITTTKKDETHKFIVKIETQRLSNLINLLKEYFFDYQFGHISI